MSKAISVRTEPVSGRKYAGQRRHDLRDPKQTPDYVDRTRTHENSVIIEPPNAETIRKEIEEQRKVMGQQKLRTDARTTIRGIITFGTEAQRIFERLPPNRQDALYQRIAARISKETGHTLLGLVVHRDEAAPHAHYVLRGYRRDADGKEQPWRHGKEMMRRIQDIAAEEVRHLGIQRGTPKEQRIARGEDAAKFVHRSVKQLHEDLPKELDQARAKVEAEVQAERQKIADDLQRTRAEVEEQRAKAEKNRRLIEEQERKLAAGKTSEEQAAKRMEAYQRREAAAKAKADELEARAKEIEAKLQPVAQNIAKTNPLPQPPTPQIAKVVVENKMFSTRTAEVDVVPAAEFQNYRQRVEQTYQRITRLAAMDKERADHNAAELQREQEQGRLKSKLIEAIARSPLAEKLVEHVPALAKWVEHVRGLDAKEQAHQQQRQRGYEFER